MKLQKFYKASIITIIFLYILILVGGFVRITESGDDCPDWPKCYGSWIPPFSIEDIPNGFIEGGENKEDLQKKVYGSWIEYFNRMVGVILGFSMLFTFFKSILLIKTNKSLFVGSSISLLLIIIAGWFGGQIADNIDGINIIYQHSVSIHLYIAILSVISIVYTTSKSFLLMNPNTESKSNYSNPSKYLLYAILALNLFLVLSGSFIRTFLDSMPHGISYSIRMEQYVITTGFIKFLHPILGFSMIGLCGILWNHIMNISKASKAVRAFIKILLILIGMQILIGEGLRFHMIHESFRLYHLWLSTVILGVAIVSIQRIRIKR